jgi:hypothetical protein
VEVHVAALAVALARAGDWEELESFYDWYQEAYGESRVIADLLEGDDDE